MPQPEHLQIVDEDDPNRCQAICGMGQMQCRKIRHGSSKFCLSHGGNKATENDNKVAVRNYHLGKHLQRVHEFADSDALKSLREEIGILRMMCETQLQQCQNEVDLLLYSEKLSKYIQDIEKLVTSCHKLEERTGAMIDRNKMMLICEAICNIIAQHVTDSDVLVIIGDKVAKAITDNVNVL